MFFGCYIISFIAGVEVVVLLSIILSSLIIMYRATTVEIDLMGRISDQEIKDHKEALERTEAAVSITVESPEGTKKKHVFEELEFTRSESNEAQETLDNTITHCFVDVDDYPEAHLYPSILLCRIQGKLLFYNSGRLRSVIEELRLKQEMILTDRDESLTAPLTILLDFDHCKDVDSFALHNLKAVILSYKFRGERVVISGLHESYIQGFKNDGLFHVLRESDVFSGVQDAFEAIVEGKK